MCEMMERIARACCEANYHSWPDTDGYNDRAEKDAWRKVARAAVEAMREPNEAMIRAGRWSLIAYVNRATLKSKKLSRK